MRRTAFLFAAFVALSVGELARAQNGEALPTPLLAEKVRNIFRQRCVRCHSEQKKRGGFRILAPLGQPHRPDANEVLELAEVGSMPPGTLPKVPPEEIMLIRQWKDSGTPAFAEETSVEYALRQIALDVRLGDRTGDRYFAFNHLLGMPGADPKQFRETLTRVINLLSWKKDFVQPTPIDPTGTIFRVNLADLGWDVRPYTKPAQGPSLNLFDLILLEYPHAAIPSKSPVYDLLLGDYLQKAAPVLPVPFVRGDWFVSAAGQPPLYEDLLQLPLTIGSLEKKLDVAGTVTAALAPLKVSGVQRLPRLVDRRTTAKSIYWRTFDGTEKDTKTGGEAVFSLPNGLPGFYIAGADGHRLTEVADDLLRDDLLKLPKKGRLLRNGLSCMRCHANGLTRLPENAVGLDRLDQFISADNQRFSEALAKLTGTAPETDALDLVGRLYHASLVEQQPDATATPIVPLDGLTHPTLRRANKPLDVKLESLDAVTMKEKSVFKQNENMYLLISNSGTVDLWYELVSNDRDGTLQVIAPPTKLEMGRIMRLPEGMGTYPTGKVLGKNYCYLYVSDRPFTPGVVLTQGIPAKSLYDAERYVTDRFVHRFPKKEADLSAYNGIEKRTVVIETRAK